MAAYSVQGIERRSQQLLAWLDNHKRQLQLLGHDLPRELQAALDGRRQPLSFDRAPLLALLQPIVAAVLKQHRDALVSLNLWLPDPPAAPAADVGAPTAAGGGAAEGSPLEGHTSLSRLQLNNFRGNAADLAALLEPAAQLEQLHLVVTERSMHRELLTGLQAHPTLGRLLVGLTFQEDRSSSYSNRPSFNIPPGLLGCAALTSLELQLTGALSHTPVSPQLPLDFSSLR